MRTVLIVAVLPLAATGCAESCPGPTGLNTSLWHVESHISEWTSGPLDPTYPADSSPMNGAYDMILTWATPNDDSAMELNIEGQKTIGTGHWDSNECGNFTFSVVGDYYGDDGTHHAYSAAADMITWDGYLQGTWEVHELWQLPNQTTGEGEFVVQVFGTL